MEFENEIWKDIDGFAGYYEISNYGRVKSLPKTMGNPNHLSKIKILKPKIDKYGYACVKLCSQIEKGKIKYVTIHRLVAKAFIPNPNNLKTVNHLDGNKQNNLIRNLEWCSHKENIDHAWATGLKDEQREHTSTLKGHKCYLINLTSGEQIEFNSKSKLSKFLGFNSHWLSSAIRNGTDYKKTGIKKGFDIVLEEGV